MERLDTREWIICILVYSSISSATAWLFYDSLIAALFFAPFFMLFIRAARSYKTARRKQELIDQFLRALVSVSASLLAGISPENAFIMAASDMEKLYGSKSVIAGHLRLINSRVAMGQRLEIAISDFAKKTRIEEIEDFAVVFSVAKEKGAGFSSVISSCVQIMENRRESENEARVLIRAKQYEQRVMCIIPPGILVYLRLSSGSFIKVLYHDPKGIAIMTACLVTYVLAVYLAERIGDVGI